MAGDIKTKMLSYFMKSKNIEGEDCIVVPMYCHVLRWIGSQKRSHL